MKVLIVDNTTTFGGAFEAALNLASHLERIGVDTCLVSAQPEEELRRRTASGLRYRRLLRKERSDPSQKNWFSKRLAILSNIGMKELPAAAGLLWIMREERADVVHLNNLLNEQPYGVFAARLNSTPCLCTHRDYEHDSGLVRLLQRHVARHVAPSLAVKQQLTSIGVAPDRISVISDSIDVERFRPDGEKADLLEMGIEKGKKIITIFGRLVAWKGHDVFLKAAAQVFAEDEAAHALIVGDISDGAPWWRQRLNLLAQDLGIEGRVTFAGYRSDIPELMRASDVVVHSSVRPEPFGLVVAEAMACGRPCIAADEGGPKEVIDNGRNGLLVPPRQPEALADAILRLLKNTELACQMGQAARDRICSSFSAEKMAQSYRSLYKEAACA